MVESSGPSSFRGSGCLASKFRERASVRTARHTGARIAPRRTVALLPVDAFPAPAEAVVRHREESHRCPQKTKRAAHQKRSIPH